MTPVPEKTHVEKELTHKSPLIACRFDSTGRYVFAAAEDSTIQRWDWKSGKATVLDGHESWVFALAPHPRGDAMVSGGADGQLIWWASAAEKPKPLRRIHAHRGWVRAACISPDGSLVAS